MRMMRLRRKFVFILCAAIFSIILFFYVLINYSIGPEKRDSSYKAIESKLKQLENGLHRHNAEVGEIKKQIDNIQMHQNSKEQETQILNNNNNNNNNNNHLNDNEMIKDSVIKYDSAANDLNIDEQCPLRLGVIPQPDIQMLDMYRTIPFDNPDGGVWKQGWPLEYDIHEWNSHHKLKVFVVPHSHNDPGWIKTFDEYYEQQTKSILTNMLEYLTDNPDMTFIWAEISFFARWYEKLTNDDKLAVKKLLNKGQLEFVTGGWVMPDESSSHWMSMLQQLTEGQTWLKVHFNVTPTAGWAIDPFGHTATMPFLLKKSGFKDILIQRTHYSVKKQLSMQKELEFKWRQLWDSTGDTEIFTHMMPFYSYDVPHTCGPDPKICCQFDFKRLHGYGLSCPWRIPPQKIDDNNVAKRAELVIDQWRKKSTLYRTRSVLIPLGDDFRYSQSTEWEAQHTNFQRLFDYINNEPSLNIDVKFSTLQEYFSSVHKEKKSKDFPSLSGDFFTYADRDDHYWSGYFTSRPYHKRLDRVLMTYLRSAEMLHAWSVWNPESELNKHLSVARRALSLFQHHDGIAGTAKDHVVKDYAKQMMEALNSCKFVIQQTVYRYLTKPTIYEPDYKFVYFNIDDSRMPGQNNYRHTIILGEEIPTKYIVLHNSLAYSREELVEFYVSKPFVMVTDLNDAIIPCQVSPVWSWHKGAFNTMAPQAVTTKYKLLFRAKVPPMGLATYIIKATTSAETSTGTSFAKITILTKSPFSINLPEYPQQVEFVEPKDISLYLEDGPSASFTKLGLLKSLSIERNSEKIPIHMEFLKYGARKGAERSGAYLFLPDGPAFALILGNPAVLIVKGNLETSIATGLPFAIHEHILRGGALEIRNDVNIGDMENTEIIMRFSTGIQSDDVFYTDLNGLQMIKRQRFNKLPIQANYYPVSTQIFIQDEKLRLTIMTAQPLGGSSLMSGQIEIMQDRRLNQDDNRGLGQGVLDNQPVLNIFRLHLENIEPCSTTQKEHPAGFETVATHMEMNTLLHPMEKLIWHENEWTGVLASFGSDRVPFESGIDVAVLRDLPHIKSKTKGKSSIGLVILRKHLEECPNDDHRSGMLNLQRALNLDENQKIYNSTLTLLKKESLLQLAEEISICPMDAKAFVIYR